MPDGRWVPGTWSPTRREFFAVAEPLGRLGRGVLECAPRFNETDGSTSRVDEEMAWIAELSRTLGRPFTFNLTQMRSLGDHYRRVLELAADANRAGAQPAAPDDARAPSACCSASPPTPRSTICPAFAPLRDLDAAGRLAAIRDPVRARPLDRRRRGASDASSFDRMYLLTPESGAVVRVRRRRLDRRAGPRARHRPGGAATSTRSTASDGAAVVNWPVLNEDFDAIAELLADPVTIMGLADAGAHATQIMDASQPTFFLSHWVRDRGALTLEDGVRRLTSDTAGVRRLPGPRGAARGRVRRRQRPRPRRACGSRSPRSSTTSPATRRGSSNGRAASTTRSSTAQPFLDHGEHTGALAGRLLRSTD